MLVLLKCGWRNFVRSYSVSVRCQGGIYLKASLFVVLVVLALKAWLSLPCSRMRFIFEPYCWTISWPAAVRQVHERVQAVAPGAYRPRSAAVRGHGPQQQRPHQLPRGVIGEPAPVVLAVAAGAAGAAAGLASDYRKKMNPTGATKLMEPARESREEHARTAEVCTARCIRWCHRTSPSKSN